MVCAGELLFRGPRVRMGIHCAYVESTFDARSGKYDYRGAAVSRAELFSDLAYGGQVGLYVNTTSRARI